MNVKVLSYPLTAFEIGVMAVLASFLAYDVMTPPLEKRVAVERERVLALPAPEIADLIRVSSGDLVVPYHDTARPILNCQDGALSGEMLTIAQYHHLQEACSYAWNDQVLPSREPIEVSFEQ